MTVTRPARVFRLVRNKFIGGLLVLIPIVITVKALWWLFVAIDGLASPLTVQLLGRAVPGIGFMITLAVVMLTGLLFSSGPLQQLLRALEGFVQTIPLVGTLYGTSKKVLAGFGKPESASVFKRFVFARLPGRTTPAFLTTTFRFSIGGSERIFAAVYVPTNHLYIGDVVVVPIEDVIETGLSVEDGISVILSAGTALPDRVVEKTDGP